MSQIVPYGANAIKAARAIQGFYRARKAYQNYQKTRKILRQAVKTVDYVRKRGRGMSRPRKIRRSASVKRFGGRKRVLKYKTRGIRETRRSTNAIARYHDDVGTSVLDYILHPLSHHTNAPTLQTMRTDVGDNPLFSAVYFNLTDHIEKEGGANLAKDRFDCSIDIAAVRFEIDLINKQFSSDKYVRMVLARSKVQEHNDITALLGTDEFFLDPNDRCNLLDWNAALPLDKFSTTSYMSLKLNNKKHAVYLDKVVRVKSNLQSNLTGTDEMTDGPSAAPVGRVYGASPRQNERKIKMIWRPKGGYRLKWKKDMGTDKIFPQDNFMFMMWAQEKTLDPTRTPNQEKMDYKVKWTVYYKDVY